MLKNAGPAISGYDVIWQDGDNSIGFFGYGFDKTMPSDLAITITFLQDPKISTVKCKMLINNTTYYNSSSTVAKNNKTGYYETGFTISTPSSLKLGSNSINFSLYFYQ